MKGAELIFLVALVAFSMAVTPGEAISCGEINSQMYPCLEYLIRGGAPSGPCCQGVKGLYNKLQTQWDRQQACSCMKSAAASFNVRPDSASNLPGKCGIALGISIGSNTDCSQVS